MNAPNRQKLEGYLASIVRQHEARIIEKSISCCMENDVVRDCNFDALTTPLDIVLDLAIQNSPRESTILISSVQTDHSIEIEIADASYGNPLRNEHVLRSLAKARVAISRIGGRIDLLKCAQGGTAYILSMPTSNARAAA